MFRRIISSTLVPGESKSSTETTNNRHIKTDSIELERHGIKRVRYFVPLIIIYECPNDTTNTQLYVFREFYLGLCIFLM